jgi:hypothetical protein
MLSQAVTKIGRNQPCPCGSGVKFKKCHGKLADRTAPSERIRGPKPIPWSAVPPEIRRQLHEQREKQAAFEAAHGKGRPIISLEHQGYRFVAAGTEMHFSPAEKTRFFPDFLRVYLPKVLTKEWGQKELAKPLDDRHQLFKWFDSYWRYNATIERDADGVYRAEPTGAMLCVNRLAYDLYLIKHNASLQRKLLDRLRDKKTFQAARFEACVAAIMAVAGFEIAFEDESDTSRQHPEFLATYSSGLTIAVEAKSRHRIGVLDFLEGKQTAAVSVEGLLRAALAKDVNRSYVVFIDVNLPPTTVEQSAEHPWFKEIAQTVENLKKEWDPGTFPVNAFFFCSDPTHYVLDEIQQTQPFWCYAAPTQQPRLPLADPQLAFRIAQAALQRARIPNQFPE